jgi:hypothetical protein
MLNRHIECRTKSRLFERLNRDYAQARRIGAAGVAEIQ